MPMRKKNKHMRQADKRADTQKKKKAGTTRS